MRAAFQRGLNQTGYVEGQNVAIEYRYAENRYDRLPELAADLIRRQVAVIGAFGPSAVQAVKAATATIPIVFTSGADPVRAGLVASLNRPGGNITGVNIITAELEAKRLELLSRVVPAAAPIAVLINPGSPLAQNQIKDVQAAAPLIGRQILIFNVSSARDLEPAFTMLVERRAGGILVAADPFFNDRREQMVALSARYALPAIYEWREFVFAGGLMSYGTSITDAYRQAGIYVGLILKGERPSELPVVQPTKFELVINLKTAKTLGLTVPPSLLVGADEVIE
jgi:putative ABC transport system substrate-binding protein